MHIYTNNKHSVLTKQFLVLLLSVLFSANLWAQAGISIFTYGDVNLRSADGGVIKLSKGMAFDTGDAILTGVNGRAQLRMQDGAIFDLKPNSEFIIEEYNYSTSAADSTVVKKEENKGFYRLMRGGFRAISGLIGKRNKKNYRITTPVATIGIRGTDFTVDMCELDCSPQLGTGLYLTVGSGGVVMANNGGSLDVDAGFGGFAADRDTAPVSTGVTGGADSNDDSIGAGNNIQADNNVRSGNSILSGKEAPILTGKPGRAAMSITGTVDQSTISGANLGISATDELTELISPTTTYGIGSATTSNQGFDATTGLFWGRWSGGTAITTTASGSTEINLEASSAHYIYSTSDVTPTIPLTGKANFTLLGNTNPTDNLGNSGTLGLASLSADFTNQTVNTAVNLNINSLTWDAIATDVPLDGAAASFTGNFDQVVISDADGTIVNGSGSLEGFFTGDAAGVIKGAGMAYSLSDDVSTDVEGSVAFEIVPK